MDFSSIIRDISGVFYSVRDIRQFIRVSRVFSQHIGILLRISQNIFPQLLYAEIFDLFEEEKIVENTGKSGKIQHQPRPTNLRSFHQPLAAIIYINTHFDYNISINAKKRSSHEKI